MKKSSHTKIALRFLWRWCRRVAAAVGLVLLLYFVIILIGLIPVNNDFKPAEDGVEIWVTSNPVHADLILPMETGAINWRESFPASAFSGDTGGATHVAIGWGDKGFFIHTRTWADLRCSTAAHALLWPSDSCLHVAMTREEYFDASARPVKISYEQYAELVRHINASFRLDESGNRIPIPGVSYHESDAFYEARGTYHALNTCNSWVGRAMRSAGIRTARLTPLPKTVFMYLPK